MFFIFGTPRSGTTLLSSILNLHDDIVIPDETDFIVPVAYICERVKNPYIGRRLVSELIVSSERYAISLGEYLLQSDIEQIVQTVSYTGQSIVWSIYDAVAKKISKRIVGDKTPKDINNVPILRKAGILDQGCKIVHIVRDPRDVYISINKAGWPAGELFMHNWTCANVRLNKAFRDRTDQYILIKYEDLVRYPENIVKSVVSHLAVSWQSNLLDQDRRGKRYEGIPHHKNLNHPISGFSVGIWKTERLEKNIFQGYESAFDWFGYEGHKA